MLDINKVADGSKLTIGLVGRLDTTTAPDLEKEVKENLDGVTELVFDMKDLEYISSAGLRVLLSAQKVMNKSGKMTVCNVSDSINEIFEVTGFSDILTII
jgi:anti-sigma B factor antagonist